VTGRERARKKCFQKTKHINEIEHQDEILMLLENERRAESHEHVGARICDNM
tara:strand:- start:817 stop:972 length:156 start_codon:yes stop_codon:yes gene_type:complete